MDGPHRGPSGPARAGGAPVTANLTATAEPRTGNIVEARDLVKSFGETPALRGASLAVRRGEIVAVMGPSGSGKSTLLHCLAGILVPEAGQVWFGGQRLDTVSDDRRCALRRDRFGFVFQSGQLVPELTAEQNVALPLLLSGIRRGPRARHHRRPGHPRRPGRRLRRPRGRRPRRHGQHPDRGQAVIPLGLRLVISGGREAITRLVILAVAVGLGVGLLLTAVAATNAVTAWNNRHAWFWTGTAWVPPGRATGVASLWWHPRSDIFNGQTINRFDVAATGTSSPVPPGIPRDPGPGQYSASPALAALLRSIPATQLAGRSPAHLPGTIGDAALPSPASLVIIVGRAPAQLAHTPHSVPVTSISTTEVGWPVPPTEANPKGLTYTPPDSGGGKSSIDLILSVAALAILAPVLIFIATATRLSAARREERFAAMRLVGATRRQVSLLAATESTAAALLGVAAGFGIFFLLRTPVAGIPFIGAPFFPGDLSLSLLDVLAVAIGVPVSAAVAAWLALRRVHISPLGVARRATPKPPRAWRVLPLLAGPAELGF